MDSQKADVNTFLHKLRYQAHKKVLTTISVRRVDFSYQQTEGNEMTINQEISEKIIANVKSGMTIPKAFDAVIGEGAYMKLAGEIFDQIRSSQFIQDAINTR